MNNSVANLVSVKLDALRNELIDLAADFDRRKRPEASEVAMPTAARLGELCDELSQNGSEAFPRNTRNTRNTRKPRKPKEEGHYDTRERRSLSGEYGRHLFAFIIGLFRAFRVFRGHFRLHGPS